MREIKFRAWDKHYERILTDPLTNLCAKINLCFNDNDLVFMQYAGLKDKNGVEIYEGDICTGYSNKEWIIRISSYGVVSNSTDGNYNNWNISSWVDELEVIGNIYENPELLEDK